MISRGCLTLILVFFRRESAMEDISVPFHPFLEGEIDQGSILYRENG